MPPFLDVTDVEPNLDRTASRILWDIRFEKNLEFGSHVAGPHVAHRVVPHRHLGGVLHRGVLQEPLVHRGVARTRGNEISERRGMSDLGSQSLKGQFRKIGPLAAAVPTNPHHLRKISLFFSCAPSDISLIHAYLFPDPHLIARHHL